MHRWKLVGFLALASSLVSLLTPLSLRAEGLPASATVDVSERGFDPPSVTIALGGTVTWDNTGLTSHVAQSGSGPAQFTVGVDTGKTASWAFGLPGTYHYTSSTDCRPGVTKPLFGCLDYTVNVIDGPPGSPLPTEATPTPVPGAPGTTLAGPSQLTVNISDTGISPASVTVPVGGSVTWLNQGLRIHTATTQPGVQSFNTGGLASGRSNTITFTSPATYSYTSSPDCLVALSTGFNCGPYTVTVVGAPAGVAATPTPIGVVPAAANTAITVDDTNGFQPSVLTLKLGQSVTWTNTGTKVHSVTSDSGLIAAFDSGGIGPGQSFSWTPQAVGQYTYHSVPDATYYQSTSCNCPAPAYGVFAATLIVGQ